MNNSDTNIPAEHKNTNSDGQSQLNAETKKGLVIALIVFLVLIVFGFIAARSLPGDALYGIKTGVIEELSEAVQLGPTSKAAHQVNRMEERLDELKALAQKEDLNGNALASLRAQVSSHSETLSSIVQADEESFSRYDTLKTLSTFASIATAMENIAEDDEKLADFGEFMEDVRRDTVSLYRDQVDRFVERETPETIFAFISDQLETVSNKLSDSSLSEGVIDDAEVYINRVGPAMAESDYARAIAAIAEAYRFIEVEQYMGRAALEPLNEDDQGQTATTTSDDSEEATTTEEQAETADEAETFTFPQ